MKIDNALEITRKTNGTFTVKMAGIPSQVISTENNDKAFDTLSQIYRTCFSTPQASRATRVAQSDMQELLKDLQQQLLNIDKVINTDNTDTPVPQKNAEEILQEGLKELIQFFTEFEFEPNFRFVNSFAKALQIKNTFANDYVKNYFKLTDNVYTNEISAKMKSAEWQNLCQKIAGICPTSSINNRFKVYYGSAGTGKTTQAQRETAGRCVICNNSMLPADLMEDFVFVNGQPSFKPSMLWECMEKGLPITLDEINLLPFEALRFLQGILDGKKEFAYKGNIIHIADGFQVIGTMNLVVNGSVFNLPEPLVDRASEMKEFKLTAKQLMSAII